MKDGVYGEMTQALLKMSEHYKKLLNAVGAKDENETALRVLQMHGDLSETARKMKEAVEATAELKQENGMLYIICGRLVKMVMDIYKDDPCAICQHEDCDNWQTPCVCCMHNGGDVDGFEMKLPDEEDE